MRYKVLYNGYYIIEADSADEAIEAWNRRADNGKAD